MIYGKRFYKPYVVLDAETTRLIRELKGHKAKVTAIILLAQNDGYLTQEQVAQLVGVTRMTLYRWRHYDYVYQYELERQYELMSEHYSKEFRRSSRRKPSFESIMSDYENVMMIMGLT
ncbi:phBC6A51 family helix-turn-helix protein [Lysinibacillus capsici]|uniref:phBC6A51 family helix-turn-helix protein n=1 Tax=Lysinibacillus capsici TaxID=2115968 RepID=UPI0028A0C725|nr:phBC6A51 family helix-turn-helix protein [Lysinibacillus capsici]